MASDIKKQNTEDLLKDLNAKREGLRAFRFGGAGGRARNVREGRTLRKEIARILTELNSRKIAQKPKSA